VITREQADRLRDELLAVLDEDAHNADRLLARLDSITSETGIGAHGALLLILSRLSFEDVEARDHWNRILAHREAMASALGRDIGVRVAMFDYFININRRLVQPTLMDLEMFRSGEQGMHGDILTGLVDDRRFRAAVQSETRRARRYDQRVSVVLFDLDDFGALNRRVGELVADRILRETAILLRNRIRDIDIAARPGEDELALVLPETGRNGALLVAERFRRQVEEHYSRREVAGRPVSLTVSGGVACYPEDATAPEELVEHAAQALYRAKAARKNLVAVFQPERRRYLRFDLEPGRFEVEILAPKELGRAARFRNLSRNGIVFSSPEPLEVGEDIEVRLVDGQPDGTHPLRIRGRVVRLEQIPEADREATPPGGPEPEVVDRYEVGVAFDLGESGSELDLLEFLEQARAGKLT
jgi:diguanylate cyclase (GGDEF)-like protein